MTGRKNDSNKPIITLVPAEAILDMADLLTFQLEEYPDAEDGTPNWQTIENPKKRYLNAAMRHLLAIMRGEEYDHKTGRRHQVHALVNLAFLSYFYTKDEEDVQKQ